ncbi:MAG: hypothetical protein HYU02_03385, partial [Thaumarchaeota archaeon]|nr:hypothetical protein [Nitrososphaerota archaeon]
STGGRSVGAFYPAAVQSGGSASTEFLLNIASDAQTRAYSLAMTISFLDQRSLPQTIDLPVSVVIVGRSNIRANIPSNVLLSGTANSIAVEISNSGTAPVYLANVGLSFVASSPLSVIEGDAQRLIDVIDANSKVTVPYKIYASASALEGLYAATLTISYRDTNGQQVSETKSAGFVVKSWVSPLVVDAGDGILLAGSLNKVTIKIRNIGNQLVSSLVATLSFSSAQAGSPLSLASGSPQFNFDQIPARGDATISAPIFAAPTSADSSYAVQIQLTYLDANGFPHSESKSVSLTVKGWVSPITVETDASTIDAGTVNKLSIKIKNTGSQPVSSIQSTLSFATVSGTTPLSLASGSPQFNFDQIPAKGEVVIAPQIFAILSATDTSYQLQLQITYVDANGYQHTETKSIGVSVKGRIVIDTQGLSVVPAEITPGSNGTVVGNLLNKGNVASHFTEARIKAEGPIRTSQASTQYIGDIDPNTPVPFSINFQVERTVAQGTYPVTVQFVYEDAYGRKSTSESKLEIRISAARVQPQQLRIPTDTISEDTARMLFVAAFAAIIVVGFAIIMRSRRKSKQTVL